jgi:hypothetical protein
MKLAIVGSRTFNDSFVLIEWLYFFKAAEEELWQGYVEVVSGGCPKGADAIAKKAALVGGFKYTEFSADWNKHGKSAGFKRNQQIVDYCDAVLAFWDGKSRGTQDTINKAKKAKKPTFIIYF